MISIENIKQSPEIKNLVEAGQRQLNALGYTEHSLRHISIVSQRAGEILEKLRI